MPVLMTTREKYTVLVSFYKSCTQIYRFQYASSAWSVLMISVMRSCCRCCCLQNMMGTNDGSIPGESETTDSLMEQYRRCGTKHYILKT